MIKNFKKGFNISIPGDMSNASFIIAATILSPGSKVLIKNLLYNKSRNGFLEAIINMGAKIEVSNIQSKHGENICDLHVSYSPNLENINIDKENIISLIDEIPILAVLATQANGQMLISGGEELRTKESDRLNAIYVNLKNMGADIKQFDDGLAIKGKKRLHNTTIKTFGDHRIAMAFAIAGCITSEKNILDDQSCVNISFPEFNDILNTILL